MTADQFLKTLLKIAIPVAAIAAVLIIARLRKLDLREDVGIRRPPIPELLLWVAIYAAWMLASNYFIDWRGPWNFDPWRRAPIIISAMRVLGVGILGPIAEELIFRGGLYTRLARTRLGVPATIVVTAAAWAFIHPYGLVINTVIFIDGILLGLARYRTKSVVTPTVMHVVWNLYAIW